MLLKLKVAHRPTREAVSPPLSSHRDAINCFFVHNSVCVCVTMSSTDTATICNHKKYSMHAHTTRPTYEPHTVNPPARQPANNPPSHVRLTYESDTHASMHDHMVIVQTSFLTTAGIIRPFRVVNRQMHQVHITAIISRSYSDVAIELVYLMVMCLCYFLATASLSRNTTICFQCIIRYAWFIICKCVCVCVSKEPLRLDDGATGEVRLILRSQSPSRLRAQF